MGPFTFQPGEVAKIALAIFFAGYLVADPRRPLAGRAARSSGSPSRAAATSARSSSPGWSASPSSSSRGTSAPRCCSSACSSRCSTSPPSGSRGSPSAWRCSRPAPTSRTCSSATSRRACSCGSTPSQARRAVRPAGQGPHGDGRGRAARHRLGRVDPDLTYFAESDFIVPSFGEELGLIGLFALLVLYVAARRARPAHRPRGPRRVRQAARRRSGVLGRPAVLRRRRRRHPGHPADRSDHAVPVLGGSSLLANWTLVAILLRISDHARRPVARRPERRPDAVRRRPTHRSGGDPVNAPLRRLVDRRGAALRRAARRRRRCIQFVFSASRCNARPDNRRTLLANYARERGADPRRRHRRSPSRSRRRRRDQVPAHLPAGQLYSHVTGYYSFTYGAGGGLEGAENDLLSGSSRQALLPPGLRPAHRQGADGASLELTINPKAQARRRQGAGQPARRRRRARPAAPARSSRMVSHPSYDPNRLLSSHDTARSSRRGRSSTPTRRSRMVNRAIAGNLYPPGSIFKIVTAAAALESGKFTEEQPDPRAGRARPAPDDRGRPAQRRPPARAVRTTRPR